MVHSQKINLFSFLHTSRFVLLFLAASAAFGLVHYAAKLQLDPSNESMLMKDEPFEFNKKFQGLFGGDDEMVAGIHAADVYSPRVLDLIASLDREASSWPETQKVHSLASFKSLKWKHLHFEAGNLLALSRKMEDPESFFKEKISAEKELARDLVTPDGRASIVQILLKPMLSSGERNRAAGRLRNWAASHTGRGIEIHISGNTVEQDVFVAALERDQKIFVPCTFAAVMILIVIFYGRLESILFPAAVIGVTLVTTQSLMVLLGQKLNPMTLLVAPVLVIVSVSSSVHMQSRAAHLPSSLGAPERLERLFRMLVIPCFFTSATTAAGMGSLMMNAVPSVREFGADAAAGTILSYFWTLVLAPFFLNRIPQWHSRGEGSHAFIWRKISANFTHFVMRFRFPIVAAGFIFFAGGIFGISYISASTDILSCFKPDSTFRRDTEAIQKAIGGIYPLEFVVTSPGIGALSDPSQFSKLAALQKEASLWPGVSHVRLVTDLIYLLDRVVRGAPPDQLDVPPAKWLARYLKGIDEHPEELKFLAANHFENLRMTFFLTSSDSVLVTELAEKMAQAAKRLPSGWSVQPSGQVYLLARMSENVMKSQVSSLGTALVLVGTMMFLMLRSFKLTALCMIANVVPIAMTLGLMPVLHMPLNSATSTIGCIALGLIEDNGIHLLYYFRNLDKTAVSSMTLMRGLVKTLPATVISSAVLAGGFAVSLFGSILPTIHFGLLMVIAITFGFFSNVIFLLALLLCVTKGERKWTESVWSSPVLARSRL